VLGRNGRGGAEGFEVEAQATSGPVSRLLPVTADAPSLASPAAPLAMELDLDCFSGPFDLLLSLVLRDELELVDVPIHEICLTYLDRIADADELDLEAATEFLILVAALLELKSRLLLPGEEDDEDDELSPEDAAALLADRLAEYARARALAGWLAARRATLGPRLFRVDPAARVPRSHREPEPASADPGTLAAALAVLLTPPAQVSISHLPTRVLPVRTFVDRFRRLLRDRLRIDFDEAVAGLDRMEQAVAFWAALELVRDGEVVLEQEGAFAPITVHRADRSAVWLPQARSEPAARVA
jgi:segregation and condensation protein A